MEIDFSKPSICRLCLNTDSAFSPVRPSEQLFIDIFELLQIQIIDIPGIPATVVCDLCKSKVEMFIEFKKNCIFSNDRLINEHIVKLEPRTVETMCQNPDDNEIKPFINEKEHIFEVVVVPSNYVSKIKKSAMEKTKAERDVCSYCGKKFLFLSQHIKSGHSGTVLNVNRFTCGLCFERFPERSFLKLHIDSIHDGKMFCCDICGKRDKSLSALTRHIRSHSKIRPFCCELCGQMFRHSKHLFDHKLRHANNRRFRCDICNKRFFTHTEINSHKLIHASDRSFKCKICNKGFKRPDHVRSHMRIHLKDKGFNNKKVKQVWSIVRKRIF